MGFLGWVRKKTDRWVSNRATDELNQFLIRLKGMSDEELGLVAAQAAHTSAAMSEAGIDLQDPHATLLTHPRILSDLTTAVIELQKRGRQVQAPGLLVWVHTLRAVARLELRYLAKEMWRQIARGFPWAEGAVVPIWEHVRRVADY
jgi:hypothetical protein